MQHAEARKTYYAFTRGDAGWLEQHVEERQIKDDRGVPRALERHQGDVEGARVVGRVARRRGADAAREAGLEEGLAVGRGERVVRRVDDADLGRTRVIQKPAETRGKRPR